LGGIKHDKKEVGKRRSGSRNHMAKVTGGVVSSLTRGRSLKLHR